MSYVGKRVPRVDAPDKAAGRAKYTADLCGKNALVAITMQHMDMQLAS